MINNSLDSYINQLQLIAFFSGYPLIYSIVYFVAGKQPNAPAILAKRLVACLPFAYALTGTFFLVFLAKSISPDFSIKNIGAQFQTPYLQVWGLLAILFWIPVFNKKPLFTLLHSLVFFLLLAINIIIASSSSNGIIKTGMNIYTASLLLNAFSLALIMIAHFIFSKIRINKKPF